MDYDLNITAFVHGLVDGILESVDVENQLLEELLLG